MIENYGRVIKKSPPHHEMLELGFIDTYRHVHPKVTPTASKVINHYKNHTKRSFPEFPSDHAGVLTTFTLNP